jgi:hypothetical protein
MIRKKSSVFVSCSVLTLKHHLKILERVVVHIVRSQVLTAASMKTIVFWVVASCSLVEVYWRKNTEEPRSLFTLFMKPNKDAQKIL